jgi:hypothetical protein
VLRPSCRLELQRHYALWSFPPHPSFQDMPLLYPVPPGTPAWLQPRGLAFALGADHPRATAATYTLVVLAVSAQQTPLRVLQVVPVPVGAAQRRGPSRSPSIAPGVTAVKQEYEGSLTKREQQQQQRGGPHESTPDDPWAAACAELEEAVKWCRVQMVVEKLKWQLQAVGAEYIELGSSSGSSTSSDSSPRIPSLSTSAGPRLMVVSMSDGTRIPCHIPRRSGLGSHSVGVMSALIEVVTSPSSSHTSDVSPSASSDEHHVVVTVCGRFYSSGRPRRPQSSSSGFALHTPPGQRHLSQGGWQLVGPGVMQRTFTLSSSDTGASIVAELVAQVRLQLLLSRLEALALPPQHLTVSSPSSATAATCALAAGQLLGQQPLHWWAGEPPNGDVRPELLGRPAKRARSGQQEPDSNGHASHMYGRHLVKQEPGLDSSAADGLAVHAQQQQGQQQQGQSGLLCWQVPGVGSVSLDKYDPGGAVLVYHLPSAASTNNSNGVRPVKHEQQWQQQGHSGQARAESLAVRVQWQQAAALGAGGAGVSCSIVRLPEGVAQPRGPESSHHDPTGPVASLLQSLQHMADAGEEGMLLDALVTCGGPMLAAEQVLESLGPQHTGKMQALSKGLVKQEPGMQSSMASGGRLPVASVRSSLPFRHTFLLPIPRAAGTGNEPLLPATLELVCLAVGYTWLHLTISAASLAAAAEAGAGAGHTSAAHDADAYLAHLVQSLVRELRPGSVHVDYSWSAFMAPQQQHHHHHQPGGGNAGDVQSWSSGAALPTRGRQLWVLVANDQLQSALRVAFRHALSG